MIFLKKLLLVFVITGIVVSLALIWLTKFQPVFKPCEPFEAYYSNDTVLFPIEGAEAKLKFNGMKYDSLPPFFLYKEKRDTLITAHFRPGYESGRFNYSGQDTATTFYTKGGYSTDYNAKGIYAYSFIFSPDFYSATYTEFSKKYGTNSLEKVSNNYQIPYSIWAIGPCHHLLLIRKKPYAEYHGLKKGQEYTYVLFVYNLSEKEIDDVVEIEGGIRNDIF